MALSNIFREPRREITESVAGIAVFAAVIAPAAWADYQFALWFSSDAPSRMGDLPLFLGMFLGALLLVAAAVLCAVVAVMTHGMGEAICDALQARGIHLRPRRRY